MCKEPLHLAFTEKREREDADVVEENTGRGGAMAERRGKEEEQMEELERE